MTQLTRRQLMQVAAACSLPLFLPSRIFGEDAPSKQITIGVIGIGWQGVGNLKAALNAKGARVVAVCDVDASHLKDAIDTVNKKYGNQDCKGYRDFRELIARADIDAVLINTPDHWHSIPVLAAAKAGKDIFCEKPLSHCFAEGVAMVEAAQKRNIIWQTGSWQRSVTQFRYAAQIVANGMIGKVKRMEIGLPSGHGDYEKTGHNKPDCPPPADVDFDFWLGPAAAMPFNPCRFHKNWRWNYNTGGGNLMDWVGHHLDIGHWGLSNPEFGCCSDDQIGPTSIAATMEFPKPDAIWNTATKFKIECDYPGGLPVLISGGHPGVKNGTTWIGENGWVRVDRGVYEASDKALQVEVKKRENDGSLKVQFTKSPGHMQEFVDSIKSRKRTLTPVEVAHRSQTPGHLALIAARLGKKLEWNAKTQQFIKNDEANKMLTKSMRSPWTMDKFQG